MAARTSQHNLWTRYRLAASLEPPGGTTAPTETQNPPYL